MNEIHYIVYKYTKLAISEIEKLIEDITLSDEDSETILEIKLDVAKLEHKNQGFLRRYLEEVNAPKLT